MSVLFLSSCACHKKYNNLEHKYMELHARKQTEQDQYKREIKEKNEQIEELLQHIKDLEAEIKKIRTE